MASTFWQRTSEQDEADVNLFKEYLRIDTRHPRPDFERVSALYKKWAGELGAEYRVVECEQGWPNHIITVRGKNSALPSIALCCHTDVVPVKAEFWTALPPGETPFSAWEAPDGKIYARGSQDMKCVGAMYVSALRALKEKAPEKVLAFERDVHLIFMPDEEIGGPNGMSKLVRTAEFKALNLGLSLDEGLAHDENRFVIFYGERSPLWVSFIAKGPMGHGAKLIDGTANDRLARVIQRMTARRDENVAKLRAGADLGECTTVNLTVMQSGISVDGGKTYAVNVVPRDGRVTFDVRLALPDFERVLTEWQQWARELDLEIQYVAGHGDMTPSPYSPTNTAWFSILKDTIASFGAEVTPRVFPAATDSRYIRRAGVNAYGFSPMRNIPSLLHDHNEYLPRSTYLEGVAVYAKVIPALANALGDLNAAVQSRL